MKTIKIASETTESLFEINMRIKQITAAYEQAKQVLDEQYKPQIQAMEQERDFLVAEAQREDQAQQQQLQQQQQQQAVPTAVDPAQAEAMQQNVQEAI